MLKNILLPVALILALSACRGQVTSPTSPAPAIVASAAPALATTAPTTIAPTMAPPTMLPPTSAGGPAVATLSATAASSSATSPAQVDPPGAIVFKIVPGESKASYEVGETLISQNNRFNVAIGTTPQINGEIQVDQTNLQNSKVGILTIDISQLQSDSSRRDNTIRERFLQSSKYPTATFQPTKIEGLPTGSYSSGEELTFKVTGDLTIQEVTKPVTFDVTAGLDGNTLTGTATSQILMSDYGFGPIQIAGILGTQDQVKLTLNFVARSE